MRGLWLVAAVAAVVYGAVHRMGVTLRRRWGQPGALRYDDVRPGASSTAASAVGGAGLMATLLFQSTAALLAGCRPAWRPIGLLSALVSIAVLLPSASIRWAGPVMDAAVVVGAALVVAAANRSREFVGTGVTR